MVTCMDIKRKLLAIIEQSLIKKKPVPRALLVAGENVKKHIEISLTSTALLTYAPSALCKVSR